MPSNCRVLNLQGQLPDEISAVQNSERTRSTPRRMSQLCAGAQKLVAPAPMVASCRGRQSLRIATAFAGISRAGPAPCSGPSWCRGSRGGACRPEAGVSGRRVYGSRAKPTCLRCPEFTTVRRLWPALVARDMCSTRHELTSDHFSQPLHTRVSVGSLMPDHPVLESQ